MVILSFKLTSVIFSGIVHNRFEIYNLLFMTQVDFCRICHCERDNEMGHLIAPCKCKGTLKYVHQSCLQQWIKSSGKLKKKQKKVAFLEHCVQFKNLVTA